MKGMTIHLALILVLVNHGHPEHYLCGIDVYKSTTQQAEQQFGPPSARYETKEDFPGAGINTYKWVCARTTMELSTHFRQEDSRKIESEVYTVEVWGDSVCGDMGITGAGLKLGQRLKDLKTVYPGLKYNPQETVLEWEDGTMLTVDFDQSGRINHMQLMASVE